MAEQAPLLTFASEVTWENKHRNVSATVERLYDAWNRWSDRQRPAQREWMAGLAALCQIVRDAETLGKRVRCLGGAWSLSPAAVTDEFMVNTKPLNYLDIGIRPQHLEAAFPGVPEQLVFAQCGVSVLELNQELEARGLSLSTSGASNGQTIGGAIATGTHGSAHAIGAMQDAIVGLHLVAEGGRHYWLERASQPVVAQSFCDLLGTERLRDDTLFNAAVVSFGSFGLLHAVLLQCEPIYTLELHIQRYDYAEVQPVLSTLEVARLRLPGGATLPFHFEVVLHPYRTQPGARGAYVRVLYKRPYQPVPSPPGPTVFSSPGDDLLGLIGTLSDTVPQLIPAALDTVLQQQLPPTVTPVLGSHGQIFGSTTITGRAMSTEIGVALPDAGRAVEAILAVAAAFPFAGTVALRYVKASPALLALTHFAPITCTIELPAVESARTQQAFERIWAELDQRGIIYTLHWGQCLRPEPAFIRRAFGPRVDDWLAARRHFLGEVGRRTFANDLLMACGLAD
jgi:hypothetical protein